MPNTLHKLMNMDDQDDFPYNQYGQLVSRKKYVSTTVRNHENMLIATMYLTIAEVTIAANERYALLQEEQIQRTAIAVATFIQPADATVGQPTMTEAEHGWLFTQVINLLNFNRLTNPRRHAYAVTEIIRALEENQTNNPDEIATVIIAQADARYDARQATVTATVATASTIANKAPVQAAAPQAHPVTPLTVDDAAMGDIICEALRVAFINNVSVRRDKEQAAQVAHPQRTQEQPHQAHPDNAIAQLSKADNQARARLQEERTTRAQNAPAHFMATCTCVDCQTEVVMQQFVLEERLMAEGIQEFENALRQPPANCPYCKAVLSPNDRNALRQEVDNTGATIEDMCHICFHVKEKISFRCCYYLQSICLACADELNFVSPQHPHDPNAPPLPPDM
jgi:hypothetical protein